MKFIISTIIIFLLIIIQFSLAPYLEIYSAFPNLILIQVIILSVLKEWKKNWLWIVWGGFLLDVFSFNNPIGASIFGLVVVSYLISLLVYGLFKKTSIFSIIIVAIFGTLLYKFLIYLILLIGNVSFQFGLKQLFFQVLYNVIILIPSFYLIKRYGKIKQ